MFKYIQRCSPPPPPIGLFSSVLDKLISGGRIPRTNDNTRQRKTFRLDSIDFFFYYFFVFHHAPQRDSGDKKKGGGKSFTIVDSIDREYQKPWK